VFLARRGRAGCPTEGFERIYIVTPQKASRNRLDHILPQGYLDGFTIPSKEGRLWVLNIERRNWFESSPSTVAAERAFYDYSEGSEPDATADQAFAEFERNFPPLRRELVATKFSGWGKHCDFLVRYSQMLRARSELFRQEVLKEACSASFLKVEEVLPTTTNPGKTGSGVQVKYSDLEIENSAQRDELLKNLSITKMRMEIEKGAGEFVGWRWHLRLTEDVSKPVITSDNAVALIGFGHSSREEAMAHEDTLFVFPICWQACLVGSRQSFDEVAAIPPMMLADLHRLYLNEADCRFAYSPHQLT
jgi:hypothetical protein